MIFAHSIKIKKPHKVSKFKDFYIFFLCSAITVSTCVECAIQIPQKQNLLLAEQKF